ncbi:MAG: 3-deoxy-manno-octulosonate cytidylyltransferase [Bacteroidales bacterium]|nr:3-deoxy-manno-octulosonate cytidylyltransferase [Bacteroidales bacterium]
MRYTGIIPARYASTRFPGKPLADIGGKPMIQRVYEQASKQLEHVIVATDDDRIERAVKAFGGRVAMTSEHHRSGTDRCAEVLSILEKEGTNVPDVVINIQGDEPFIQPGQIAKLMECFTTPDTEIATLVKPIHENEDIFNPNKPKVILNCNSEAIYFSRSPIPYVRNFKSEEWEKKHTFYKHIGMYAYRSDILKKLTKLAPSVLEVAESLEQLRWVENGYKIRVSITNEETIGIDTPEDLEEIKKAGLL